MTVPDLNSPSPAAAHPAQQPPQRHLLPDTAEIDAYGRLSVGGVDLVTLAQEHGTPLFVYDEEHLRARCREAVQAWGDGVAYATKAFLCQAMARLAMEEGLCLDVSTAGELHTAIAAGVPGRRLVFHGNNKSEAELARAIEVGVRCIVLDSFDEIQRLERLVNRSIPFRPDDHGGVGGGSGQELRVGGDELTTDRPPVPVMVRVTPGVEAHTHEFVRTGHDDTKFGFTLSTGAATEAVDRLRDLAGVTLIGVHAHIGSQVFDIGPLADSAEILARFFQPLGLSELCVGGGLGVAYVNGEQAPSLAEWAGATRAACTRAGVPDSVRITAEPGRSIVASAAITLYRIGTIKVIPGVRTYVSVDGGMSDNPRPVLYGSGYEAFLPRATRALRPRPVRVVGKHCETGDVVVSDAYLPEDVAVDDVLATPVTGAYGYSMASNYNKVPRPPVLFVRDGRARVVVRGETLDDLLRLDAD